MDAMELSKLIAIQHEVREEFGWAYRDDQESAENILQQFKSEAPFGLPSWNFQGRQVALESLTAALNAAEKIVFVGAAVSDSRATCLP